jgi:hypothetical protein
MTVKHYGSVRSLLQARPLPNTGRKINFEIPVNYCDQARRLELMNSSQAFLRILVVMLRDLGYAYWFATGFAMLAST